MDEYYLVIFIEDNIFASVRTEDFCRIFKRLNLVEDNYQGKRMLIHKFC